MLPPLVSKVTAHKFAVNKDLPTLLHFLLFIQSCHDPREWLKSDEKWWQLKRWWNTSIRCAIKTGWHETWVKWWCKWVHEVRHPEFKTLSNKSHIIPLLHNRHGKALHTHMGSALILSCAFPRLVCMHLIFFHNTWHAEKYRRREARQQNKSSNRNTPVMEGDMTVRKRKRYREIEREREREAALPDTPGLGLPPSSVCHCTAEINRKQHS